VFWEFRRGVFAKKWFYWNLIAYRGGLVILVLRGNN
jgi:hypothetical protein